MKYLLTITLYLFLSTSYADSSLVDPDSFDSSMNVVTYQISAKNLKITAYHLGSPSKLKVKLCRDCLEKTYQLDPEAELKMFGEPLNKTKLTETLLRKKFSHLHLAINRSKGMITYLYFGVSPYAEFTRTPMLDINRPNSIGEKN